MADVPAVFRLGMDLGDRADGIAARAPSDIPAENTIDASRSRPTESDENKDHFIMRDGKCFAGTHLIIDLWGAERLDELDHVEKTLVEAVEEAGATLLHIHLHHFTPNGGVSGVAVLAESHISIHSWPERGYAALDVFMCGDAAPEKAIPVLRRAFRPAEIVVSNLLRGEVGRNGETAVEDEAA
ncbi:MAG TPA: adenosylmethionine decarboxylase [Alphaproteobacteria bacterium]|nr:adenosylmethionine decarboxylase [Alphaproteobacteria bacterium]